MSNKKSIVNIVKDAAVKPASRVRSATGLEKGERIKSKRSASLYSQFLEAAKGKKAVSLSSDKLAVQKLKDDLNELQASYSSLNELFNNTVSASDATISSLLKDLRYTVDRLDKADFSLKYDVASGSLFVDGEDSISVSTPEVLAMLTSLTSLFPNKSISLSIDGDADYTDGAALDKLSELNGSPVDSGSTTVSVQPAEDDIDKVLGDLGDSNKVMDNKYTPEERFVCTYQDDAYSVWDKELGTLVKVVTTPKEADALLEGLITGVSSTDVESLNEAFIEPEVGLEGDIHPDVIPEEDTAIEQ